MEKSRNFENFDHTQELEYPDWSTSSSSNTSESEEESDDSIPDISGLKPYDFEPEIPYVEDETIDKVNQNQKPSRIGNVNWCTCGECKPMESETESFCCLDTNEVPDEYFEG